MNPPKIRKGNNMGLVRTIAAFIEQITFHGLESFGKYYSSYRGIVYSNEDPDGCNRLKLIIPTVAGDQVYNYWSYPKDNFSGKGYGVQCLPQKGDVVWVTFEGGNPEIPVWEHGHFALKEKPINDPDFKDPKCFWFQSPGGNYVKINDTKKTIHIQTKQGDYIEVNPKSVSLVTTKQISLGTLDKSQYSAVLGEELRDILKELISTLQKAKTLTAIGPQPFMPDTQVKLTMITSKLQKILSKRITLDK